MSYEFQPPEENESPQISADEFLAQQKRAIRRKSYWALGIGIVIVVAHLVVFGVLITLQDQFRGEDYEPLRWGLLFRSVFFILALMAMIGGAWGLYYARTLQLKDLVASEEAIRFLLEGRSTRPYYSLALIIALVAVTIAQLQTENVDSWLLLGNESSKELGLVKPKVWAGEWWRILTSATLHGIFPLHLYFNSQALFGLGTLIEQLSNRAHLPIIFLLSVIVGGGFSIFFMPDVVSIGASGGIMGTIGYMAVFGYKRKRQLPPDFLRSILVNIVFIGLFGVFAYQFIDNFAHLGGLVAGAAYGFVQIPADPETNPRKANFAIEIIGALCLAIFLGTAVFAMMMLTETYSIF